MSAILIVDDEPSVRRMLTRMLTPAGHHTKEAESAEMALSMLAAEPVDLVISDVQMPGRDGLWLIARMRESFPTIPVVLATGDDTVPPAASFQPGIVAYLLKPLRRELVLAAVARAIHTVP
jgi:CheY-like chemotaxis protein